MKPMKPSARNKKLILSTIESAPSSRSPFRFERGKGAFGHGALWKYLPRHSGIWEHSLAGGDSKHFLYLAMMSVGHS
eukprot:scaffold79406_cov32-Tisochrysis_lutea.AAC.2